MNLTNDKTWDDIVVTVRITGGVMGYIVIGVLTAKFITAIGGPTDGFNYMVGFLWPIGLPIASAVAFPAMTLVGSIVLIGGTFLILRRIRQKQIAKIEEDKLLREAGVI